MHAPSGLTVPPVVGQVPLSTGVVGGGRLPTTFTTTKTVHQTIAQHVDHLCTKPSETKTGSSSSPCAFSFAHVVEHTTTEL